MQAAPVHPRQGLEAFCRACPRPRVEHGGEVVAEGRLVREDGVVGGRPRQGVEPQVRPGPFHPIRAVHVGGVFARVAVETALGGEDVIGPVGAVPGMVKRPVLDDGGVPGVGEGIPPQRRGRGGLEYKRGAAQSGDEEIVDEELAPAGDIDGGEIGLGHGSGRSIISADG